MTYKERSWRTNLSTEGEREIHGACESERESAHERENMKEAKGIYKLEISRCTPHTHTQNAPLHAIQLRCWRFIVCCQS